ncbi:cupin domain-containing protein [Salinarimonas soli]|uniref:Cupin domain-containing protein n=1 Tax=Salinarimonas soli TaxID=1638099 RepID=A0A5B2VC56_9HYPH|nr:cupin domain-containing protein [Salinarimonas soli]KAA2236326.1 cupin domain-containing protein [Salinarimonas soli]
MTHPGGTNGPLVRRAGEGAVNRAFDLPRTFLIRSEESGGELSHWVEEVPAGAGPPLHVHHREREMFRILSGRYRFVCSGMEVELGEGDTILIPPGAPHTFKNIGAETGRLLITMSPGGAEGFFEEVDRLGLHPARNMPEIVALAGRYGLEFVGPPLP